MRHTVTFANVVALICNGIAAPWNMNNGTPYVAHYKKIDLKIISVKVQDTRRNSLKAENILAVT